MLRDLLIEANNSEGYKFDEIIFNPEEYLKLTNNIFNDLQKSQNQKIQTLIKRFYHREQYRPIGEGIQKLKNTKKRHSKEQIRKYLLDIIGKKYLFNIRISKKRRKTQRG